MIKRLGKIKVLAKNRYFIYHMRWQFSGVVMLPFMMLLEKHLPLWQNLAVGSLVGATIFWFIDKRIFHDGEKKETDNG